MALFLSVGDNPSVSRWGVRFQASGEVDLPTAVWTQMRLLLLNHNYRFSGTYYRAHPMAQQLAQRGHRVTLLTVSRKARWRPSWEMVDGMLLGEMPNWGQNVSGGGYGPLDNLLRLVHVLARRYDIIHMFDHKPNATFGGFLGRLKGTRLVADWADWWGGPGGLNDVVRRVPAVAGFEGWWEERSKLGADGVVTISTVLRDRALSLGCRPDRVLYLPTGAPLERIRPVLRSEARRRLGVPGERSIVGFIGTGQTDLEIVLSALRDLPDVWLMVVGATHPRTLEAARSFGVADRLWQTGFVPDAEVGLYLGCADVMVLPMTDRAANRGRLPNKLLDYMAAGRPTVASPVGDVEKVFQEYDIGSLAQPEAFAQAIRRLMTSQSMRERMGCEARRVAETVFAWPSLIERLEGFYGGLLADST